MKQTSIAFLFFVFIFMGTGIASGAFSTSAHGNSSYGVKRTSLPAEYSRGNCAHCHEQHSSLGGSEPIPNTGNATGPDDFCFLADNSTLPATGAYSKDDCGCFFCHASSAYSPIQDGEISNKDYSTTFGGGSGTKTGILDTFNQASYHNLKDIYTFITDNNGYDYPDGSSPCSGCHNVHITRRNKANTGDPEHTAISRPSDHGQLWGDDSPGERMTAAGYGVNYQPPLQTSTNFEPDGATSVRATQAGKTPDYNTFCIDCHNSTNIIYSTSLARNLKTINWNVEKHGKGDADDYITVDSPYTSGSGSLGYILSCLDCHEPHGSANAFLIRAEVNNAPLGVTIAYGTDANKLSNANWDHLCNRCHQDDAELHSGCTVNNFGETHHSTDYGHDPYESTPSACGNCHSFTPETPVLMHDNTLKPIGEIETGDRVLGFDSEKSEIKAFEVVCVSSHFVEETISFNGIETTANHPFAVDKGSWVEAGRLKGGDTVMGLTAGDTTGLNEIQVENPVVSRHPEKVEVIDISVMGAGNFFVAGREDLFLVHNQGSGGGAGGYICTNNKAQITCTDCHYHGSTYTFDSTTWRTF